MDLYNAYSDIINELFSKAKERDEFEFCRALLRFKSKDSDDWDALGESSKMIKDMLMLFSAPIDDLFRIRLLLLLYCNITQMSAFYNIIANLLLVASGERYREDPFGFMQDGGGAASCSPAEKVEIIAGISDKAGLPQVGELYRYMLVEEVRDAFFRSDYAVYKNVFRIINGKGITVENTETKVIPFEWLLRKIELTINVLLYLYYKIDEGRKSYREEKTVRGRVSDNEYKDVKLIADENGLKGLSF
jgi:hypothetical protein